MRLQIGWYDPGSKRFTYMDVKESCPDTQKHYTVPVFADDEPSLWHEIQLQILENQYLLLEYGECILNEQRRCLRRHDKRL